MNNFQIVLAIVGVAVIVFITHYYASITSERWKQMEKTCSPYAVMTSYETLEGTWAVCGNREVRFVKDEDIK